MQPEAETQRRLDVRWVEPIAAVLDIPFSAAGGITSVDDAREVICAGADKASISSPALRRPARAIDLPLPGFPFVSNVRRSQEICTQLPFDLWRAFPP